MKYSVGDKVQIYIPRGDDPDHRYHSKTGEIVDIFQDELSEVTETPGRGYCRFISELLESKERRCRP